MRNLLMFLMVGFVISGVCLIPALTIASPEDEMKAAFVFYFAKFVEWPASAFADERSPLVLGVLGGDTMNRAFSALEGKTVKNRTVQVKLLARADSLTGCHILFIGAPVTGQQTALASVVQNNALLTVSDSFADFAQHGIVANIIFVDNRIKLELSSSVARRAGLTISSQVLQLAKVVDGDK